MNVAGHGDADLKRRKGKTNRKLTVILWFMPPRVIITRGPAGIICPKEAQEAHFAYLLMLELGRLSPTLIQ